MTSARSESQVRGPFQLGEWKVEPSLNKITKNGLVRKVTPKAMQVLVCLADRPSGLLSRQELLRTVWHDTVVGEETLTRSIADLRKALADDRNDPSYIETIPKGGYRLIGRVTELIDSGRQPVQPGPRGVRRRNPAVLAGALVLAGILLIFAFRASTNTDRVPDGPIPTRPLTALPGTEIHAEFSPDGRSVAFAWRGPDSENWDVYLREAAGEGVQRLTESPATDVSPAWSPDGEDIAFMRYSREKGCEIYSVPAAGGAESLLGGCGGNQTSDLVWSPRGDWMAYADRPTPGASFGIFLFSPETGERKLLVSPPNEHWGDKDPSFSPDGSRIAFTRSVGLGAQDIFVIPVQGGIAARVTDDSQYLEGHGWMPDGRSIVYSSQRRGRWGLWEIPLLGGEPAWIGVDSFKPLRPHVSRNRQVVFRSAQHDYDLKLLKDRHLPGDAKSVEVSTRSELLPALSPDRSMTAFVSNRSGAWELWVGNGQVTRRLTSLEGSFTAPPRWSADGREVLFDCRPHASGNLYKVSVGTGDLTRLTGPSTNDLFPAYSADGQSIFFGSNRSGRWQVWKMPRAGGTAVQVTHTGGFAAQETGDGRFLYLLKFGRDGLWRIPRPYDDASETRLESTRRLLSRTHWTAGRDGLHLLFMGEGGRMFGFLHNDREEIERLMPIDFRPGSGLSISGTGEDAVVLIPELVREVSDLAIADLP